MEETKELYCGCKVWADCDTDAYNESTELIDYGWIEQCQEHVEHSLYVSAYYDWSSGCVDLDVEIYTSKK